MILEGTTSSGAVVPVQVTDQGRVVAEGLPGPEGPAGPEGPPGPAGGNWARTGNVLSPTNAGDSLVLDDGLGTASVNLDAGASASPLVRDSSGRLLVGTAGSHFTGGFQSDVQINKAGAARLALAQNTADAVGSVFTLSKSRGSVPGATTATQEDDALGVIQFAAADGTSVNGVSASVTAKVDGAVGGANIPGRIEFSTAPSGSSTPVERMRIDSQGDVIFQGSPVIKSPNGNHWAIEVDDSGNLSAVFVI